jgi:hypothetical protein
MGLVALSRDAGLVGTMTSRGTDVMEIPASTSWSATVVGGDVVVGGGGRVRLDVGPAGIVVGGAGIVVVASVVLAAVDVDDSGVEDGAVGATAGNEALGAHPAATSTPTMSAFDRTVPATTELTVVRALR